MSLSFTLLSFTLLSLLVALIVHPHHHHRLDHHLHNPHNCDFDILYNMLYFCNKGAIFNVLGKSFFNMNLGCVNLGRVNSEMSCEFALSSVSIATFVTLERLIPSVCYHVALQFTRRGASEVALVTLVWLFSCMLPHHMFFQMTSPNTGILAHCASVRLFPRVGPFVLLQIAWMICSIIALDAFVWVFSSVFPKVPS